MCTVTRSHVILCDIFGPFAGDKRSRVKGQPAPLQGGCYSGVQDIAAHHPAPPERPVPTELPARYAGQDPGPLRVTLRRSQLAPFEQTVLEGQPGIEVLDEDATPD